MTHSSSHVHRVQRVPYGSSPPSPPTLVGVYISKVFIDRREQSHEFKAFKSQSREPCCTELSLDCFRKFCLLFIFSYAIFKKSAKFW